MNILLFGGSGFVSGRVLRYALDAGHTVTAITRGNHPLPDTTNISHIKADRNETNLGALLSDTAFDVVLDVICQTPAQAAQAMALARDGGRIVMVSSDYAYDPAYRKLAMTEAEARFSDREDYGGNKRNAELVLLEGYKAGACRPTILRPGTIPQHGRRPNLLDDIAQGKTLNLLHGGLGLIQPIHADDLARIILEVAAKPEAEGEDYTACGPDLMSHLDYYRTLARCIGKGITHTAYCPAPEAEDVNHYVAGHRFYDRTKLKALLPEFTYTPFDAGMLDWVAHLRAGTEG